MCARHNTASRLGWQTRPGLLWVSVLALFLLVPALGLAANRHGGRFAYRQHQGGQRSAPHPAPQVHPAPPPHAQQSEPSRSLPEVRAYTPHPNNTSPHPGQQHLPEWLNNHRNMTPQEQENALRHEPGFSNLPADQQQRLVNRLRSLDAKTPEQRQRLIERNEMFERLSPERRQEVRGASQALGQMSPERQLAVRQAFRQLRYVPPGQREQMLNSQAYTSRFSPQERTVLGNLLSIEPYQHPNTIPQPYFGR